MNVSLLCDNMFIMVDNDLTSIIMGYDEAYQLIEDLTEALKKCPVKEPKEDGDE